MAKENYFGGKGASEFMWGKGAGLKDSNRYGIPRKSEETLPHFAEGGPVSRRERFDNYAEVKRIHRREAAEARSNRDEMHRIHDRARDEHGRFAEGGAVRGEFRGDDKRIEKRCRDGLERPMMRDFKAEREAEAAEERDRHKNKRWIADLEETTKKIRDEHGRFAKGGRVKGGMFNNPKIHKGGLHESLGIPEGKKIGQKRILRAEHAKSPLVRKQAVLAENMIKANKYR